MDSTSIVASFQFQEIDYLVMLVMMAFLGWRIGEMLLTRKKGKVSRKDKISEDCQPVVSQLKCPAGSVQSRQKGNWQIPPTQTPVVRAAAPKPASPERVSGVRTPPGLQPPPGLPLRKAPAPQVVQDLPWRKMAAASQEPAVPRELARVVAWKETGYGFVVDEAGVRLFARQAEVDGGEQLRAGQLIWFRRGKAQAGQAAKALNITVLSQEEARVMRRSASPHSSSSPKVANKALALPSAPLKGVAVAAPPTLAPAAQTSGDIGNDDDLSAFLGTGSKEEQIKNLKYAPQWVADKFWSQQAQQEQM